MKKNTLSFGLIVMTLISAIVSFYSIYRAIKIPESSTWIVPIVWVSFFVIMLCAVSIFVRNKMEAEIVIAISLLSSVLFALNVFHFAIVSASVFLMLGALRVIRNDLDLNVKISLWKSLNTGKFKMIFALALIICSQYYFTIKTMNGAIKVPKLDFSSVSEKLVGPMLGIINPNFETASKEDLTVDEFIIKSQSESENDLAADEFSAKLVEANIPENITVEQRETLVQLAAKDMAGAKKRLLQNNQQLVLQEGRRQLATIAGKELNGSEKISVVFSNMINDKINSYFDPNIKGDARSPLFSLILTLILLLTIWPIGSVLSIFWFGVVILMFKLFVKLNFIEITKITIEREMIA